jgi:DNA-binding NarL/FixJ family response regulator
MGEPKLHIASDHATRRVPTARPGQTVAAVRESLLTMAEDPLFARDALQADASGYVRKQAAATELVGAIRAAAGGSRGVARKAASSTPFPRERPRSARRHSLLCRATPGDYTGQVER